MDARYYCIVDDAGKEFFNSKSKEEMLDILQDVRDGTRSTFGPRREMLDWFGKLTVIEWIESYE